MAGLPAPASRIENVQAWIVLSEELLACQFK